MCKCYISGKISGLPYREVLSFFHKAENIVLDAGMAPVSPTKLCQYDDAKKWEDYMLIDIEALFKCQHIYMLNNWEDSRGARIEHNIAKEIGLTITYQENN